MTYERTMKIKYTENELTDTEMRKLAHDLQQEGLDMVDWGNEEVLQYGFKPMTTTKTRHVIKNSRGKVIYSNTYRHNTAEVYNQIKEFYKVTREEVEQVTTIEGWVEPNGTRLSLVDESDKYRIVTDYVGNYYYEEEEVQMLVKINNSSYQGFTLEIITTWKTDKIQRADLIKQRLVELPLEEVGKIQTILESCLSEYRVVPEHPEIDCHFDAKTETTSECSPDIIKLVREARNQ